MNVLESSLKGVMIIKPDVFQDNRGFFMETYQKDKYEKSDLKTVFVQDNLSYSSRGTLRGLHYQHPYPQAKLVQAIKGEIYDVAVDIRIGSSTFGQWAGVRLSDENRLQLYVPEGFAHGFCVLSNTASVIYKCSDFYTPHCEGGIVWCDPDLGIEWPLRDPLLSKKDGGYPLLKEISAERLPVYEDN